MNSSARRWGAVLALGVSALVVGCERPPTETVQRGYRGTGMVGVYNPRTVGELLEANKVPDPTPVAAAGGPSAASQYKNVKVLNDLSVNEFTRVMVAITGWVAPKEGCAYCHKGADFADDSMYTKVVARKMLEMTRHINADWKNHVAETGVTCYTCHRGNPVPAQVWFGDPGPRMAKGVAGGLGDQNLPGTKVGLTSMPHDPFSRFFVKDNPIRVIGGNPLRTDHGKSIQATESTYSLMIHMSESLGVNCTYCHNSRSFGEWSASSPPRTTAWYGIRMARDINSGFLEPLTPTFPAERLGPKGDVAKVNCGTCHQGVYKPLYGAQMAKNYPALTVSASTQAKATDGLPPPMAAATRSVLYFGVGSSTLEGEQAKGLTQLIATLSAKPAAKASISGYHSASGELASNQQLAKDRAVKVRDSIVAAGIAPARVQLDKPLQAEANLSGEDPAARRVEVSVK